MLTHEEFLDMALKRPVPEDASVYRLSIFNYDASATDYHEDDEEEFLLPLYKHTYLLADYDAAVNALHRYIEETSHTKTFCHHALIERMPVTRELNPYDISWWLFDREGELVDRSVCCEYNNIRGEERKKHSFFGRKQEEIRFKPGDIVEVVMDNAWCAYQPYSRLAIVIAAPKSIEQAWEQYKQKYEKAMAEDKAIITVKLFDRAGHDWYSFLTLNHEKQLSTRHILRPVLPVSQDIVERLERESELREKELQEIKRMEQYVIEHMDECVTIPHRSKRRNPFNKENTKGEK